MGRKPSIAYLFASAVGAMLAVVGAWLPWVRKQPVGTTDGQLYYTSEWVSGLETGFQGFDVLGVLLAISIVLAVFVARRKNWRPDGILIGAGGLLFLWGGATFNSYRTVDRYVIETGLYLVLVSGCLFVLLGVGTVLKRRFTATAHP
ncbi:hypothetical protein SAMN06269185_2761 [Natronoarchaeum philippinense]|uniref:Uncharacterized protein n=1 Tax=Natronoarchaeum philippinense TaxID=558529 RepID=A0A285P8W3_NATPI|nr:hypothetical protein [Natronoarchaeum philippinense]SNZ16321.1 hypothetical protein SAMN06269185_2761 [Natronoarchaeum philippinense]